MQSTGQSPTSTFPTILLIAIITLVVAVLPVRAQNAAPPTWRGAPVQAFTPRLAPPGTPRVPRKSSSIARTQIRRGWPLDDNVLYENGPVDGQDLGTTINFGFAVSDSLQAVGPVTGMQFWAWLIPGDTLTSAEVQIGAAPFGNELFDQTLNFTASNCFSNEDGYNVCLESANFTGPTLSGNAWLTLSNATVPSGDPTYWDMNNGVGCQSPGCPSQAQENTIGTIPSEAFTLLGSSSTTTCWPDCPPECVHDEGNFKVIHEFAANEQSPAPGLAIDQAGKLYGATGSGGDDGLGLAYQLALRGQGWIFTPLYSFLGGVHGQNPSPEILGPERALYGTADGGIQNCGSSGTDYCGVVYRLRPSPVACLTALCSWTESVIYRFTGNTDAWGGSVSAFDSAGNLYGISSSGGAYGQGAVYKLTPANGGWTERVIYNFTGQSDGAHPNSLLLGQDGNLYGTTVNNIYSGAGVIFQLVYSGNSWTEETLATFGGCSAYDGECFPELTLENRGDLFGIFQYRIQQCNPDCWYPRYARIFEMSPSGSAFNYP